MINSIGFYFLLPIYVALALLILFFNIPEQYYFGVFIFYVIVTVPILLSILLYPPYTNLIDAYSSMYRPFLHKVVILLLCILVITFSPLDIYVNGLKLLNPSSYAEFHGPGRFIRHITDLCFILIPVAFTMLRSKALKVLFISYALLFPILIVDRNRLLMSCYGFFLCIFLTNNVSSKSRLKKSNYFLFFAIAFFCIFVFALVGHFRSGHALMVASSGALIKEGQFPLTELFVNLPILFQQIILYVTTPIFNFATIVTEQFNNPDLLLSQFSPFSRENFDAYPYTPILVARFNVGTELFPFLLYAGLPMVCMAFLGILFGFLFAFYFVKQHCNIFTLLIFIKISYCVLFIGFAPQFYILLNLIFVILMFFLWFFSDLMALFITMIRTASLGNAPEK